MRSAVFPAWTVASLAVKSPMSCPGTARQIIVPAIIMTLLMVGVSLKDLWKSSNINGLQAASKAFILNMRKIKVVLIIGKYHLYFIASQTEDAISVIQGVMIGLLLIFSNIKSITIKRANQRIV